MLVSETNMLTDQQVLALIKLKGLPRSNKKELQAIISSRGLKESQLYVHPKKQLNFLFKILLIICPACWQILILLELIIGSKWLIFRTQWKQFWFYLRLGFLFWFVAIMLLAKYVIFA
jgi:hypothetical protein